MASLEKKYSKYIRKHHSKMARVVWPPDTPALSLGDFGVVNDGFLSKGVFQPIGNLSQHGVDLQIEPDTPADFALALSSSVEIKAAGSGPIPSIPGAQANIELEFRQEGSAILSGEAVTTPRLKNLLEIRDHLVALRSRGIWDTDYRLVVQLRHFPSAFLAISKSSSGKLVLGLKGTTVPALGELGKANVDVTVAPESDAFLVLEDARNITPIVYVARLERNGPGSALVFESLAASTAYDFNLVFDLEHDELGVEEKPPHESVAAANSHGESLGVSSPNSFASPEALAATDEEEFDESAESIKGSNEQAPPAPSAEAAAGFDRRAFDQFIESLGLRHFSPGEFLALGGGHSNPGSPCFGRNSLPPEDLWPNIAATANVLDELRSRLGVPITLSSVFRNESYNSCIGGARFSQHKRFNAADFTASERSPVECARELFRMRDAGLFHGGVGLYRSFVHVDTRGRNAEWAGSGASLDDVR